MIECTSQRPAGSASGMIFVQGPNPASRILARPYVYPSSIRQKSFQQYELKNAQFLYDSNCNTDESMVEHKVFNLFLSDM